MIRRSEHSAEKKYTIVSRALAQDESLSFQARGLLLYILSKPNNWKANYEELRREGKIGRTALDNLIKELRGAGYVTRHRERGEDGKLEWVMVVYEEPQQTESQCTPASTGTSVRPPSHGKRALAINSTGARAGSSVDLKRSNNTRSAGYKVPKIPPEPKTLYPPEDFEILPFMRDHLAERFITFSETELEALTDAWRRARNADATRKRDLFGWQWDWLRYVCTAWENRSSNGNGRKREDDGYDYHSSLVGQSKPVGYFDEMYKDFNQK